MAKKRSIDEFADRWTSPVFGDIKLPKTSAKKPAKKKTETTKKKGK